MRASYSDALVIAPRPLPETVGRINDNEPMIKGAPVESRWVRSGPRRSLPVHVLREIVNRVFPCQHLLDVQPLESLRNANFILKFVSAPDLTVLRIYEHEPSLCRKELGLLAIIRDSVPVPEVLAAEPDGLNEIPPFVICRYVEGIEFRELKRSREACPEAAYAVGRTLAHIGRTTFASSGWLGPGASVLHPLLEGANPIPRFTELCLASPNLQRHMKSALRERTLALVWSHASELASLEDTKKSRSGGFWQAERHLKRLQERGLWQQFSTGNLPFPDLHWLMSATFCGTNASRVQSWNPTSPKVI